jgi:hypothetical protein
MDGTRIGRFVAAAISAALLVLCAGGCSDNGGFAPSTRAETLQTDGGGSESPAIGQWDNRNDPGHP